MIWKYFKDTSASMIDHCVGGGVQAQPGTLGKGYLISVMSFERRRGSSQFRDGVVTLDRLTKDPNAEKIAKVIERALREMEDEGEN